MIKIEIQSREVTLKTGISTKSNKPYSFHEQEAWGFFYDQHGKPHPHPMRVRVALDDGQEPYAPGFYFLAPESIYPDRWGQMAIRARLRPVAQAAQTKAA